MRLVKANSSETSAEPLVAADVPAMPWDHAMKTLATGDYDVLGFPREAERGPDLPGGQTPAPGVDPVDGDEEHAELGQVLTNVTPVAAPNIVDTGLPKMPPPVSPTAVKPPVKQPVFSPSPVKPAISPPPKNG